MADVIESWGLGPREFVDRITDSTGRITGLFVS